METLILGLLAQLGIPSGVAVLLYFIIKRETEHRKEERDSQIKMQNQRMDTIEASLSKHINRHEAYEKSVCGKIDKIYERLNPISDSVNFIKGVLEGKNDKG